MTPTPPAPGPKKRGLGFWLALGGGALLSCCLLTAVCGALAGGGAASGSSSPTAAANGEVPAAAPDGVNLGDDVVYQRDSSSVAFIAPMSVVGPQVLTGEQLLGAWQDDHRNLGLALGGDGAYQMVFYGSGGGASVGYDERGTWSLAQGALTLTPAAMHFRGVQTTSVHTEEEDRPPGPPRAAQLDGLLLEYQPAGVEPKVTRRIDGLHLVGPAPDWYSASGQMDVTLRRARSVR